MYYITYFMIFLGAIQEAVYHKKSKSLFKLSYFILFMMAVLRYGQGQDYFNYEGIYHEVSVYTKQSIWGIFLLDDFGYAFLNYIAISLNFPYELFMAIITAVTMLMFYSFLKKRCECSMVGLYIFYSVIFMIYPLSVSRQGLCMAFFLCCLYPLLEKNKIKTYIVGSLIISTIHASALIFLLFPIVYKYQIPYKLLFVLFIFSLIVLFFSKNLMSYIPVPFIQDRMKTYLSAASSNMMFAKILRLLLVFPLFLLPSKFLKDSQIRNNYRIFLLGFFVYALISFSELVSSRLWGYFLGFECLILSKLALSKKWSRIKVILVLYYIFISTVLWFKDIGGAMEQGKYRNCTMINYPYISIFEGENSLKNYRTYKGHAFVDTK